MRRATTLAWIIVSTLACSGSALADTLVGKVIGVTDGDTVTVLDKERVSHKVRLSGIDAPEQSQSFGSRSRQHLAELVFGKDVTVEYRKKDRYGRIVGKVVVSGLDTNLAQVAAGMAWHYKHYEMEQPADDRIKYDAAEVRAREERRGLWADNEPVPPWKYRVPRHN